MPDNAKIVVIDVEVFDRDNGSYESVCFEICRKKPEILIYRCGLDYLHDLDLVRDLDLCDDDRLRVCFRVFDRPPYKLAFVLESAYLGCYKVKSGIDSLVLSCESFYNLAEVD